MANNFLYYEPGQRRNATVEAMQATPIGYAFESQVTSVDVTSGPDGRPGVVLCESGKYDGKVGYYPDQQTWRRIPRGDYWVGRWNGPMDPVQLQRQGFLGGYQFEVDGAKWYAPVAYTWAQTDPAPVLNVPRQVDLDEQGQWIAGPPIAKYRSLTEAAARWWSIWTEWQQRMADDGQEAGTLEMEFAEENELCVCALAHNYRLSAIECVDLGLLTSVTKGVILGALIDLPRYRAFAENSKKNGSALASTT